MKKKFLLIGKFANSYSVLNVFVAVFFYTSIVLKKCLEIIGYATTLILTLLHCLLVINNGEEHVKQTKQPACNC
jgi:hypothetical protein